MSVNSTGINKLDLNPVIMLINIKSVFMYVLNLHIIINSINKKSYKI